MPWSRLPLPRTAAILNQTRSSRVSTYKMQSELTKSPVIERRDSGSRPRRLPVSPEFIKFIIVGGAAYFINQFFLFLFYDALPFLPAHDSRLDLWLFTHPDVWLLISSIVAVELAIVFKFWAHEHWTFPGRRGDGSAVLRFLQFNATCILSPIITVATVNVLTPVFGVNVYVANTVGTILGFLANWVFSAYLIWPHRHHETEAVSAS
jgi:putative flippase GtrA